MSKLTDLHKLIVLLCIFIVSCIFLFQLYIVYQASEELPTATVEKVERKTYTIDYIAGRLIYTRDERTGLCFASTANRNSNLSFTMVLCTEKVLRIIKERGVN